MALYVGQLRKTSTDTSVGVGSLECGSTLRRIKLRELILGSDGATLGTSNFRWEVWRITAVATGSLTAPEPLDPADAASLSIFRNSLSANGTTSGTQPKLTVPMSQQTTVRWIAPPGGEIIVPATANNGVVFLTPVAGNAPPGVIHVTFEE